MIWLDSLFRFSGISFLLLLLFVAIRDGKRWNSAPYLALSCISVAALFAGYAPELLQPPEPMYGLVRFLDVPHLVFVWLFALSLYDSNFQLRHLHAVVGVCYCLPIFWIRFEDYGLLAPLPDWVLIYGSLTSVALMAHLCIVTLSGRADDLIEERRASRLYFILLIVFVAMTAAIIDPSPDDIWGVDKRTAKVLSIWPAIGCGVVWLVALNQRAAHFGNHPRSAGVPAADNSALKDALNAIMRDDEVFREPGLTISALAQRLGVSQHKLRALINTELGYANFSAYLNTFRIEAVKQAFTRSEAQHLPILTIAMECGFNSLSTFNSAFKVLEGVTPSAYRNGLKT